MKIIENSMKINGHHWKTTEILDNQWKSMEASGGSRRHGRSLKPNKNKNKQTNNKNNKNKKKYIYIYDETCTQPHICYIAR